MRGTYKGYSYTLYYISVFILISFSMLSGAMRKNTAAMIVFMILAIAGGTILMILASRIPCHVSADESGFTITEMGLENRFGYDSVTNIEFKYIYARYGALIKLTIKDKSMGEAVFCEVCRSDEITDLIADPENGKRPCLAQLCDYVKQAKEAGA